MGRGLGRFLPLRETEATAPAVETRSLTSFESQFRAAGVAGYSGYSSAWQIPSAWRASTLLGGLIGCLPLEGFRAGQPKPISPTPILLSNPTPLRTNIDVYASWVHDYLFHGNAVGLVGSRDAQTGWPTSLIPIPADWVTVMAPAGYHSADLAVLAGDVRYRIGALEFTPWDVLHVRGPAAPGSLRGVGVLEAALSTFELARDQRNQASSVGAHGVPTGLLYADDTDVTPEEMREGRADFMRSQQGGRTVAALPPGVKFQALSWNPEELQLIEARKMSDADMALLFGLPGSFLNVESGSLNYSNVGQDGLNLLKYSVNQILVRFEQEISRLMPRTTAARFDRDAILETDTMSRYQTWAAGISAGFLLKSEAREREGLPAVAGIDDKPQWMAPPAQKPAAPAVEETDAPDAQEGEDK